MENYRLYAILAWVSSMVLILLYGVVAAVLALQILGYAVSVPDWFYNLTVGFTVLFVVSFIAYMLSVQTELGGC